MLRLLLVMLTGLVHCRHHPLFCRSQLHCPAHWSLDTGYWRGRYYHRHAGDLLRHCPLETATKVFCYGPRCLVHWKYNWSSRGRQLSRARIVALVMRDLAHAPNYADNLHRCFHINYPFCGIGFIIAACFVRMNATTELTFAQKLKQTDWVGAFLFIGSFTSFLVGLSFGGVQHPWTSAAALAPLIVGVAGIGAFLGWQVYRKPQSLLPMSIFYNWSAIAAFYNAMVNGLVVSAVFCQRDPADPP